jgi:molecular chaperone GrpE
MNKKKSPKKDVPTEKENEKDFLCSCEDCQENLKKIENEKEDLEKKLNRALADYQNLQRNSTQEKVELLKYSLEKFFLEILPIYNNLKIAISTLSEKEKESPWVEGVTYVIKQFKESFQENGLEEIKTIGEKFDYNKMEAVKGDGDIVKKEIRPGYFLNGKVIIPAKVVLYPKDDFSSEENK